MGDYHFLNWPHVTLQTIELIEVCQNVGSHGHVALVQQEADTSEAYSSKHNETVHICLGT